ncbi:MAG: SDR family oxidoreductase [Christensenellaceae bacterium]|nr:SDR family oxidoreductase [Christensenellaceae bacterium]
MKNLQELNINRDLDFVKPITIETITSRVRDVIPHRFDGKVAIVTGGTSGIGLSCVEELLKEGASVAFTGRNLETAKQVLIDLEAQGFDKEKYLFIQADTALEESCRMIADRTYETFGKIDYLVNNAFAFDSTKRNIDNEVWMRAFTGGPLSYARMMKFCGEYMVKNGGGAIVNVSSISGHIAQWGNWTYNTMKGVVGMLSRSAAMDFARDNIRVNLMSPAHIWTRRTNSSITGARKATPEQVRAHYRYTNKGYMLNRAGEAIECAAATLFLLSDDASYITGSEFMVDGGFLTLGSQGCIDKGFRDHHVYGITHTHGDDHSGTLFKKPQRDYPELFGEYPTAFEDTPEGWDIKDHLGRRHMKDKK